MIKKKASGITLFAALVTGLSSSHFVNAKNDISSISESKGEGKIRSGNYEGKSNGIDITKLLAFGIGSTALTTGTVSVVNDEFNKNSEINTVNQLSSKIKEQENAINRLTQTSREDLSPGEVNYQDRIKELEDVITQLTLAAKAKINELENVKHSGEQTNKQGINPFATVMYVTVSLVMIIFLASLLLILYKLKNAGVFEAINLVGPIIKLIKETFEIKKDLSLEGLKKKLVTVKKILEDPKEYVCKEIKELYSKLNGIELKNIVSLEGFEIEYKSLLESNNGYTYKEASTPKLVSKILNNFKQKFDLDTVPADKAYKAVLKCLEKKKNKLENENEKKLKKIKKIKKEKSEKELNNIVIRKANFLKRNQAEMKAFNEEFAKLYDEFHKMEAMKKSNNEDKKIDEVYNNFLKEYNPKFEIAKHVFDMGVEKKDNKLVLNEVVEEEVDTKKYDAEISKLDKEIEENNKKISKIDILNNKLGKEKRTIIKIISEEKTLNSVFNKINNYIKKETADDDFDEIVKLVNDYANALKEENLINLISEQKVGKEKLKETIIPTLELVKKVAIFLNEKRKNLNKNEIVDIGHQNTNLEVIIKNVTNLLAALNKTLEFYKNEKIGLFNIPGFVDKLKDNYNALK